ncbi:MULTISPECIES: hypothetical protein [unclassified Streptomyces]|uniref:hypothetical protein n=1 Tax=unclassified Streptomyces TaxID=2593676 RepID=UPI00278BE06A|nr:MULTISPECIES: hypothetical protein [unclassified Streptomyces]
MKENDSSDASGSGADAAPEARPTHLSLTALRARGWTKGMVRDLLGEPDRLGGNPVFRSAPPARLYALERVELAERSGEFAQAVRKARTRVAAARAAAERNRRETIARIAAEPIDVPQWSAGRLAERAVAHRNRLDEERVWWRADRPLDRATVERAAVDGCDASTLRRWQVDFLRHRLIRYDELLDGLFGRTGRAEAEQLLRRRVYDAIRTTYPHLAQECERQLGDPELDPPPR